MPDVFAIDEELSALARRYLGPTANVTTSWSTRLMILTVEPDAVVAMLPDEQHMRYFVLGQLSADLLAIRRQRERLLSSEE
jgi:hypothetical protein